MSHRLRLRETARSRRARPSFPWLALLLSLGAAFLALPAAATMYKWVDANGKVVYSDQPPPGNVKSEIIKPPPPPDNPDAVKEMVNATTEMKLREKQKIEKAKEEQKKQSDALRKQELCQNALTQLKTLQRDDLYRYNDKGERFYLDAETRAREADVQQKIARENCAG